MLSTGAGATEREMVRLIAAMGEAVAGWNPPDGAAAAELDELRDAFAPLKVPDELCVALSVMNGCPRDDMTPYEGVSPFIWDSGLFMSCGGIVAETRQRAEINEEVADEGSSWSPSFIVITADRWSFQALTSTGESRSRSAVVDLSYGNPNHYVDASSLTALIAASADAWESGLHPSQIWAIEDNSATRAAFLQLARLTHAREDQYPSDDGLQHGDAVNWRPRGWPKTWLQPQLHANPGVPEVVPLAEMPSREGDAHRAVAVVVDQRAGRWLRVHDDSLMCWLDVPSGLEAGHVIRTGDLIVAGIEHVGPWLRRNPPSSVFGTPALQLRANGVFDVRHPPRDSAQLKSRL